MRKNSESGNVLEIIIIAVLLLAVIGLLVWRFIDNKPAQTQDNANATVLAKVYDPVKTPEILPKLASDMKSQKLAYGYMSIGEWNVKVSTIDTTNSKAPYYLNYRWDVTDSDDKLVSVVVFSGADDSGKDGTCADGATGPVVYVYRDTTADSLGQNKLQPVSDLNIGNHVFHIYKEHCTNDSNTATADAIIRQLETTLAE